MLNSLEGKHPFPRNRPPFPVTHGFEDLPTVINNVETFSAAPPIVKHGADWYQSLGLGEHAGTKAVSLSGDIQRPGNYEIPMGLPLRTLLEEWAGGAPTGRSVQAVTMAGLSGGFLAGEDLEVSLDEPDMLVVARNGSPLLLGVGEGEHFIGSDASPFIEFTKQVVYLSDEQRAKDPFKASRRILELAGVKAWKHTPTVPRIVVDFEDELAL